MACSALAVLLAVTSASVRGRPGENAPRGPSPGQLAAARKDLVSRDFQLNINATQRVEKMARQSKQVADAVAAIDFALARDPDRVVVFGHSLGGAVGLRAAAARPMLKEALAASNSLVSQMYSFSTHPSIKITSGFGQT